MGEEVLSCRYMRPIILSQHVRSTNIRSHLTSSKKVTIELFCKIFFLGESWEGINRQLKLNIGQS